MKTFFRSLLIGVLSLAFSYVTGKLIIIFFPENIEVTELMSTIILIIFLTTTIIVPFVKLLKNNVRMITQQRTKPATIFTYILIFILTFIGFIIPFIIFTIHSFVTTPLPNQN